MEQKSDVKNNGPELRMKLPTVESNLIPMNGTNLLLNLLMVREHPLMMSGIFFFFGGGGVSSKIGQNRTRG